jgi:hypothetical protein
MSLFFSLGVGSGGPAFWVCAGCTGRARLDRILDQLFTKYLLTVIDKMLDGFRCMKCISYSPCFGIRLSQVAIN